MGLQPERESSGRRAAIVRSKAGETPVKRMPEAEASGEGASPRKRQKTDSTALVSAGEGMLPVEQV